MKAAVVYESIFGNTKLIAEAIARGLRRGFTTPGSAGDDAVALFEVSDMADRGGAATLASADLLVIGAPTHAFGMTRSSTRDDARRQAVELGMEVVSRGDGVREWIASLSPRAGRRIATFDTIMHTRYLPTGSAARRAAASLRKRGHDVVKRPMSFEVTSSAGPLEDGEIARAERWGEELALLATRASVATTATTAPV